MWIKLRAVNDEGKSQQSSASKLIKSLLKWQDKDQKLTFDLETLAIGSRSRLAAMISITRVRLCESRPYCGNHAGPCRIQGEHKNSKAKYLEGGDWVEFNDKLNDLLDRVGGGLCADVASSTLVLRKGPRRRTVYAAISADTGDWVKNAAAEHYADYRKSRAPRSLAEAGTPGLPVQQYL